MKIIWYYFSLILGLPELPQYMSSLWGLWRSMVRPSLRNMGDLIVKAIAWNVWLAKNDHIFNANAISGHVIMLKVDCMFFFFFLLLSCSRWRKR